MVEAMQIYYIHRLGGYAAYPPWESLASVPPQPIFPTEDKLHNFRVDGVDPILGDHVVLVVPLIY